MVKIKLYVQKVSCVGEVASLPISQSQLKSHWGVRCRERNRHWNHHGRFQGLNRICCQSQGPPLNLPQLNTRYTHILGKILNMGTELVHKVAFMHQIPIFPRMRAN